jgi:tetratricopeptide (TPR) repeat protein
MKFYHPLSPVIAGVAMVWMVPQVATAALSSIEVGKIAEEITVLIDSKAPGSGIILKKESNKYTVLTAYHVVAKKDLTYKIVTPDGAIYAVGKIQPLGDDVDLALVEFTSNKNYKVAKIGNSDQTQRGAISYLGGFPGRNVAFSKSVFNFTEGKITANSFQSFRDGYALVYDNTAVGGMSGGPVLNENGEVIGIHGRGDNRYDERTEQITVSNFKLGIPINTFVRLAAKNQVDVGVSAPPVRVATTLKAEDFFVKGVNKSRNGDYKGAVAELNQAISLNPQYVEALGERGGARYSVKDYQGAIQDFTQAIKINPNFAEAYIGRGASHFELKNYQEAVQDLTQAIKINPNFSEAYIIRGGARLYQQDYQGVVQDFTQAIKMNPNSAEAYIGRGSARLELKDYQGVIQDLTQAIKLNPKYAQASYMGLAVARINLRDYQGAVQDLTQAIKLNPNDGGAYMGRGSAYELLGKKQKAIADFQAAAQLFQKQGNEAYYLNVLNRIKELQ